MSTDSEISKAEERLRIKRNERDFPAQLAAYRELGRVLAHHGDYQGAADMLEKAATLAEYLDRRNELEGIFHALIAVHEAASDVESAIAVYGLLHLHWKLSGDPARAAQYNNIRLELVAQQIGKKDPSFEDRVAYEHRLSHRSLARANERQQRLVTGVEEPTFPDEHVEACDFLVCAACNEGRFDEALRWISMCERTISRLGAWTTSEGGEFVQNLKQTVGLGKRSGG